MSQPSTDGGGGPKEAALPFRLRPNFMSTAEVALYRALKELTKERYVIFTKVALNEVFFVARPNENVHYFSKLFRKYVDFLLCDPESLKPQIGIEIVRTRAVEGIRDSDKFVEELFFASGLPLVQVHAGERLKMSEMVARFREAFARVRHTAGQRADRSKDSVPSCPVCGKMMVLRTQRGGRAEGRLYYGCVDNPTCPGRVAVR